MPSSPSTTSAQPSCGHSRTTSPPFALKAALAAGNRLQDIHMAAMADDASGGFALFVGVVREGNADSAVLFVALPVLLAAGLALANERALETVQRVEERNTALLDAIPDLMFRVARDGTYLDVRSDDDQTGLVRPPEELLGRSVSDTLPADVAESVCTGSPVTAA